MLNQVFGPGYADAYDFIYSEKDYDGECDLLCQVFTAYAAQPVRRVLDLGCGTGNHSLRLARKGYEVVGVDRSAAMLGMAARKADEMEISMRWHQADIRDLDLAEKFDAALMMFAVLGYQVENSDVLRALRTARRHLHADGLLVFDVWYGPAVLVQRPGDRIRLVETQDGTLLRTSSGELDLRRQVCTVHYHLWHMKADRILRENTESHSMRYFFPRELELFLEVSGFRLLRLGAFLDFEREPDQTTWNTLIVARSA